jgi:LPS export ABC transporter permease LptF
MQIYQKYIIKKLFVSFLYCISSILAVVWLTRSNDLLQLIVNNGIGLSSFFTFSFLAFPEILYNAIPIGVFVSVIAVFMKLRQTSEIFALRNVGLADIDLAKPVLITVTIITILHLLISCSLAPMAKRTMTRKINKFNEKVGSLMIEDSVFVHPTGKLTIYTEKKPKLKTLTNIFVSDKRTDGKDHVIYAKRGSFVEIDNQTYLHLFEGTRQTLSGEGYISMDFSFLALNVNIQKSNSTPYKILPNEKSLIDLVMHSTNKVEDLVELYNRIILPLVSYIVALVSLYFVLKYYKTPRSSMYTTFNFVINFSIVVCFIILTRLAVNNYNYCFISICLLLILSVLSFRNIRES